MGSKTILILCLAAVSGFAQTRAPQRSHSATLHGAGSLGYLGVGVLDLTDERVKALKLKDDSGVEVKRVDEDSPASKAGLKDGRCRPRGQWKIHYRSRAVSDDDRRDAAGHESKAHDLAGRREEDHCRYSGCAPRQCVSVSRTRFTQRSHAADATASSGFRKCVSRRSRLTLRPSDSMARR